MIPLVPPSPLAPARSLPLPGLRVSWEKLPEDFVLPDDPVDNLDQIPLGNALTDLLWGNDCLPPEAMTSTRYAIVAKQDGKTIVKAPDWAYIPHVRVPREQVIRSYTPHLEGDPPALVVEFLSLTEGDEYSQKSTYPPGKWFFYEQILKVPTYVLFDLASGRLEVYRLDANGRYQRQSPDANGRYWIPELNLSLGLWEGTWQERTGLWLRWWTADGVMLPFTSEKLAQEQQRLAETTQRAEEEKQRAEEEKQRAEEEKQRAEEEKQRAEEEKQRAEEEKQRADQAEERARAAEQRVQGEQARAQAAEQRAEQERRAAEAQVRLLVENLQQAGMTAEQIAGVMGVPLAQVKAILGEN